MKKFIPKIIENKEKKILWYPQLCKACGLCSEICPRKAIAFNNNAARHIGNTAIAINLDKCIGCKQCDMICPDCAIKVIKL